MKILVTYPLFFGILFSIAGHVVASETPDARQLLDRFRSIDWSEREVGQDKDLFDDAWKVRIEVENALMRLGGTAVVTLIEACQDSNKHVRLLAAYVLGCLNHRPAAPALMRIVDSDTYAPARLAAIEALGRLGAKEEALSLIQAATQDENPHVSNAAKWALSQLEKGERAGDALRDFAVSNFDENKVASAVVGNPAPDFVLTDDAGATVRLADFRGKKNVAIIFLLADW